MDTATQATPASQALDLPHPDDSMLRRLKRMDDARPGMPGEHLMTLAAGLGLWLWTRNSPSLMVRTLGLMGGTALVARAASGRDGLAKWLRYLPVGQGISQR